MTDVTITGVAATSTITAPAGTVITESRATFLKLTDADGNDIEEVHYESVFPGDMPRVQMFTIGNYGTGSTDIYIDTRESDDQLGSDFETYGSTFLSLDNATWQSTLEFTLTSNDTQDFYVKYLPPSTAGPGPKQWQLHLEIPDTEETPTMSNNFLVTSTSESELTNVEARVTILYVEDVMKTDFGDIRFFDGTTELGYYLESKTDSVTATFVILIPTLPGSATPLEITVYAGNPDATTTSDPDNVYLFFDHFPGTAIDTSKWTNIYHPANHTVADSIASIHNGEIQANMTFTPPFSVELGIAGIVGSTDWFSVGLNHEGQPWDKMKFLAYNCNSGTYVLQSDGCSDVTETLTFPTVLEMKVASNAVYDNYHDGVWYQGRTGGSYSSPWTIQVWAGEYRDCTLELDYIIFHHLQTHTPTVGSLALWEQVKIGAEIKAGLSFRSRYLPGVTPIVKHSVRIGGYVYD